MPGTRLLGTSMPGTRMPGTRMPGTRMPCTRMQRTRMLGTKISGTRMQVGCLAQHPINLHHIQSFYFKFSLTSVLHLGILRVFKAP